MTDLMGKCWPSSPSEWDSSHRNWVHTILNEYVHIISSKDDLNAVANLGSVIKWNKQQFKPSRDWQRGQQYYFDACLFVDQRQFSTL